MHQFLTIVDWQNVEHTVAAEQIVELKPDNVASEMSGRKLVELRLTVDVIMIDEQTADALKRYLSSRYGITDVAQWAAQH